MRYATGLLTASILAIMMGPAVAQETPAPAKPGAGKDLKATYITREEIETVEKATPIGDRTVRVLDIGHENFAVGVVHRGKTVNGRQLVRGNMKMPAPSPEPCGRKMEKAPEGGYAGGITHDLQTEGYYITSGGGTMFTDGYIVNGVDYDLADLNGPTCLGTAYGVTLKTVKQGDIIIIPAGVVHGWIEVPDHVDYVTFRPSPGVLQAGWVSPALQK